MNNPLWSRSFVILMASNFASALSFGALKATLPLYVRELGGDNALAGTMAGAMTIAMMLSRLVVGSLMDRVGKRRVMLVGGPLFVLLTFAHIFTTGIPALFVLRIAYGLATCFFTLPTSTLVADIVPQERLVDGVGYFNVLVSVSAAIGPMTGTMLCESLGFRPMYTAMAVLANAGIALTFLIRDEGAGPAAGAAAAAGSTKLNPIERSVLFPAIVSGLTLLGYSAVSNFLPVFGVARGIRNISIFFVINGACMVAVRLFSGRLAERFGYTPIVVSGLFALSAGYAAIVLAADLRLIVAAGILFGVGGGIASPILNVLIFRLCPPERKGSANATYGLCNDIGNGSGAALWGFSSQALGFGATYLMAMLGPLLALVLYWFTVRKKLTR